VGGQSMGSTMSAKEVRQSIRNYIQNERDTVLIRWRCLGESVRAEDNARDAFHYRRQRENAKSLPVNIQKFIGTLKRAVRKTMREKGGTPFSIVRALFMYWTSSIDGTLTSNDLKNCMNSLGVRMTDSEREEVVAYYDSGKGHGEMSYAELLQDITHNEPTTIQMPSEGYYDGDDAPRYAEVADEYAVKPVVVQEFIEATRDYIWRAMRNEGGTPYYHVRHMFQCFDWDLSNGLNAQELHRAVTSKMKLSMILAQAEQIVKFYDRKHEGQMGPELFLQDVQEGELSRPMLSFKELTSEEILAAKNQLAKNIFMPKPFKATSNRVLEDLKLQLKRTLTKKISLSGGRFESWLLSAFREYDKGLSNRTSSWEHIRDVMMRLGVTIPQSTAVTLICSYDKNNTGEMHYLDFIKDMDAEDPHFLAHTAPQHGVGSDGKNSHSVVVAAGDSATARCPPHIAKIVARFKRASDLYALKSGHTIPPRDLLHGTFLRFDSAREGHLVASQVAAVAEELGVPMLPDELKALMEWFDARGSSGRMLDYSSFTRQVFGGDDVLTRQLTLPKLSKKAGSALYKATLTYDMSPSKSAIGGDEETSVVSQGTYSVITRAPKSVGVEGKVSEVIENKKQKQLRLQAKRALVLREREEISAKLAAVDAVKKKLLADHANRRAREAAAKHEEDSRTFVANMALQQQLRKEQRDQALARK